MALSAGSNLIQSSEVIKLNICVGREKWRRRRRRRGVVSSNRGSLEEEGGAGEISTSSDRISIAEAK